MLSDKEMTTEVLTLEKSLACLYHTAVQESSSEPLHCNLKSMMNDALTKQQDTFKILSQKGWYKPKAADASQVAEVKAKFSAAAK